MQIIVLHTTIDDPRRLVLDLPENTPLGEVEITIRPVPTSRETPVEILSREEIHNRLEVAGLLAAFDDDEEGEPLSADERDRIGRILAQHKSLQEMIDEERGD